MTNSKILLGGLALLFVFSSCSKEVDELPPATQTGANTFGAKVNGKNWTPARFGIIPANNLLEAFINSPESIIIYARNFSSSPTETVMELQIGGLTGPGVYHLNKTISKPSADGYAYYVKRTITPEGEWQTSTDYTGTVTITKFDRTERIISGTFEFRAGNLSNPSESITVSDGRFDVKYN